MESTAKEKLQTWFKDQKENHGLVDMKFTFGDTSKLTVEDACASILDVLEAKKRGDCRLIATSSN